MINKPIGLDFKLQEMQKLFIANLWLDIPEGKKSFNHRVFKNRRDGLLIPEIYTNKGNYQEVLFDDRLTALSWFDVADSTTSYDYGSIIQEVGIFFVVNLEKLHVGLTHRTIEEAHLAVQKVLLKRPMEFMIESIVTGERAYGDFPLNKLKYPDMQPWHAFRFNCSVTYQLSC